MPPDEHSIDRQRASGTGTAEAAQAVIAARADYLEARVPDDAQRHFNAYLAALRRLEALRTAKPSPGRPRS
jgi:hypothetical protein